MLFLKGHFFLCSFLSFAWLYVQIVIDLIDQNWELALDLGIHLVVRLLIVYLKLSIDLLMIFRDGHFHQISAFIVFDSKDQLTVGFFELIYLVEQKVLTLFWVWNFWLWHKFLYWLFSWGQLLAHLCQISILLLT